MNELSHLSPPSGSTKSRKRVGRGLGSGLGRTAGRGYKGQRARAGHHVKAGFEGGQMPLQRRLPKRGFKNHFKVDYFIINVKDLNRFNDDETITLQKLIEKDLVPGDNKKVKLLGDGELTKKVTISINAFSKSAKEKIEKLGGKIEVV
jgi:large subunit ribosomal protein L15